jgi:hypothetical protein
MSQQINLYRDDLRPLQILLPARLMLGLVGALVVLLLLVWFVTVLRVWSAEAELADLKHRQAAQQQQIMQITEQLAQRVKSPVLEQQVRRLERDLDLKRQLLAVVSGESEGNSGGFSAQLAGLGRHQRDGLWFTHIGFSDGGSGLRLEGRALDARLLPAYLQDLAAEPAYLGKEFTTFWMRRPEDDTRMDFVISTHCPVDDAGECAREGGS